eukprot:3787253-Amphidinium_carterae.1
MLTCCREPCGVNLGMAFVLACKAVTPCVTCTGSPYAVALELIRVQMVWTLAGASLSFGQAAFHQNAAALAGTFTKHLKVTVQTVHAAVQLLHSRARNRSG